MKNIYFLCLIVSSSLLVGCDDEMPDYYDSRAYELHNFDAVALGNALQVEIIQGAQFSVVAKGETPDLEDLELRVENGVLTGGYRHGGRSHKRTQVVIFMPQLTSVIMESATDAKMIGFDFQQEDFFLQASGASTVEVDANSKFLEARVEGASELILKGEADVLEAHVGGASHLKASGFSAIAVAVEVGGASDATVTVLEELEGRVEGNSLLRYHGNPKLLDVYVASDSRMNRF